MAIENTVSSNFYMCSSIVNSDFDCRLSGVKLAVVTRCVGVISWWDFLCQKILFDPHRRRCVLSLSKTQLSSLSTGSTQEDSSRHN